MELSHRGGGQEPEPEPAAVERAKGVNGDKCGFLAPPLLRGRAEGEP